MRFFFILLLFLCSCSTSHIKVSAPADIKSQVHGHLNSIPDCWTAQKIANVKKNHSSLTVKKQAATEGKTVPLFVHNGQRVGGYQIGACGGDSTIIIAAYSNGHVDDRVLKHEICHHLDMQGPCLGGHDSSMAKGGCCPFWPNITIASFEAPILDGEMEVRILSDGGSEMVCVERKVGEIVESAILFPDISVSAVEVYDGLQGETFWAGLKEMSETLPAQAFWCKEP